MSPLLAKFLATFGPLLTCRPKILFLHWSSLIRQLGSSEVLWKSEGLDPGQNISKGIRINFLPTENEYIFLSFCLEVCQNKHPLDLSLSKSRVLGEDPLLNACLPFWNIGMVWSCSEICDLLQVDDLHPSCLLRTNCSEITQVLISSAKLHISSTFPLFLNLFVTFPFGSPLLNEEDHTEMEFERKVFWNHAQWTKYSHLELIFPNFPKKNLVFLPVEPILLWLGKGFWPKMYFWPVYI